MPVGFCPGRRELVWPTGIFRVPVVEAGAGVDSDAGCGARATGAGVETVTGTTGVATANTRGIDG
jgi:hypothetical protein